jgi:Ca-activated chloride channel family protein
MEFVSAGAFILCLFLIAMAFAYWRGRGRAAIKYPDVATIRAVQRSGFRPARYLVHSMWLFRMIAVGLMITALARPQWKNQESKRRSEGLDIMLAIDTSGSMRALDFEVSGQTVDRLEAVKSVIEKFVSERLDDRIGMVVFGSEAFTQAPLTLDHRVLLSFLKTIRIGVAGDATAIGDAIATASNRLKDIEAKSKVVILLTDGKNTAGKIEPMTAAKAAATLGIKIYTIGVGKEGQVPITVDTAFGKRIVYQQSDLDEKALEEIASLTGARFFRAQDTDSLAKVYETIDQLEKSKFEIKEYRQQEEAMAVFLWPGLGFLLLELLFSLTRFKRIP